MIKKQIGFNLQITLNLSRLRKLMKKFCKMPYSVLPDLIKIRTNGFTLQRKRPQSLKATSLEAQEKMSIRLILANCMMK